MKIGILLLLIFPSIAFASENQILIKGKRKERYYPKRAGSTTLIRPNSPTRFDTKTHLKEQSTLEVPETGKISASGFVLPKIRGQETKMTEVYLGNILLQNPYTGLPIVDDIDIQAFGELSIFQGVSPIELPSSNPIGTIRYQPRPILKKKTQIGTSYGRPFGSLLWGKYANKYNSNAYSLDYSLYIRHHDTNGKYSYYSDNATPYNKNDDSTEWRENNHKRGDQALTTLNLKKDRLRASILIWGNKSTRGVPSQTKAIKSLAREDIDNKMLNLSISYQLNKNTALTPNAIAFNMGYSNDTQKMKDPTQTYLWLYSTSKMDTKSTFLGTSFTWKPKKTTLLSGIEWRKAWVKNWQDQKKTTDLTRDIYLGYLTSRYKLTDSIALEGKFSSSRYLDSFTKTQTETTTNLADKSRKIATNSATGALLWNIFSSTSLYLQYAETKRAPTLLEEFGNGATILGNTDIDKESLSHAESGIIYHNHKSKFRSQLTLFQDLGSDKIVFVKSMNNTMRAKNIDKTSITGIEVQLDKEFNSTQVKLGVTRLYPYDKTGGSSKKILPGISKYKGVLSIAQNYKMVTIRLVSRYRSQAYRDTNESIIVPSYLVHDIGISSEHQIEKSILKLGIKVDNFTNVTKLPIYSPKSDHSKGYTSYSTIKGEPLPGRDWKIFAEVEF